MSSNSTTENVTILVLVHLKIKTKGDISGVAINMTGGFFADAQNDNKCHTEDNGVLSPKYLIKINSSLRSE